MYLHHYGLHTSPFDLGPNPAALFLGSSHKEGLAALKYAVAADKLFVVLTGGVGVGKTTLISALAASPGVAADVCLVSNPNLEVDQFYHFFGKKIGLGGAAGKAEFLLEFVGYLEESMRLGRKLLLVIDEAQAAPLEVLEEIRLLTNCAAQSPGSLNVILAGQPELLPRLADERLSALRQRIGIRFLLEPFSAEETLQYILFRLNVAGARQSAFFTAEAAREVHLATGGNPRLVNILCDQAMLAGYSQNLHRIDQTLVRGCAKMLELPGTGEQKTPESEQVQSRWLRQVIFALVILIAVAVGGWLAYRVGLFDRVGELFRKIASIGWW